MYYGFPYLCSCIACGFGAVCRGGCLRVPRPRHRLSPACGLYGRLCQAGTILGSPFVLRGCLCGGGHTHTAMLADVQLTTAAVSLISRMCHVAPRNGPFCAAIWPVSAAKTARFGSRNGSFRNTLSIRWLAGRRAVVAININEMNVRILPNRSALSPPFPKEGQGWFVE